MVDGDFTTLLASGMGGGDMAHQSGMSKWRIVLTCQVSTPLQSKLWQGCSHQFKLDKQQRQLHVCDKVLQ
uniref:Uncharacterized protein n=1 Tax=Romanomermis culicivorax TaxID=13658 RepID=A0A915K290_ROMCU